jgi:hypothetical protein
VRQTRTSPLPHRIDALECIWAFHHYNIVKMPSDYLKGWTKQIVFHVIFQVLAVLQTWIFVGILCTGGHDNISMVLYITFYKQEDRSSKKLQQQSRLYFWKSNSKAWVTRYRILSGLLSISDMRFCYTIPWQSRTWHCLKACLHLQLLLRF